MEEGFKIIIAIDGFSSCGKSTLAKELAKRLGYIYVDTGAMYRAVTLYVIENNININSSNQITAALNTIDIKFQRTEDKIYTLLNGVNVEEAIRTMRISNAVSEVSALPIVREAIVAQQKEMGKEKGIVMEGRDIGTVVFPDADLKIFLTAQPEIRVQRRFLELKQKGKDVPIIEIRKNLEKRDMIDSNRAHSPLRKAEDAVEIDNSFLDIDEQIHLIQNLIRNLA